MTDDTTQPGALSRRHILKAAGAAATGMAGFPAVHTQEKLTLRYLDTAMNQDKSSAGR